MIQSPVISPYSSESMGGVVSQGAPFTGVASATWPVANLLIGYPFRVSRSPTVLTKLWLWKGTVVAGNLDLGVYDATGRRLFSTGTTAMSAGTSVLQVIDIADVTLGEGDFYLCMSMDGTTATTMRILWPVSASSGYMLGEVRVTSAFVLPATVTWAYGSDGQLPMFGALVWPRTVM